VPQQYVEVQENPKPKPCSITWAQRVKRVFAIEIEIEKCEKCGGPVRVIASIEDTEVIPDASDRKILKHLGLDSASSPQIRSPPETLFDHSPDLFRRRLTLAEPHSTASGYRLSTIPCLLFGHSDDTQLILLELLYSIQIPE